MTAALDRRAERLVEMRFASDNVKTITIPAKTTLPAPRRRGGRGPVFLPVVPH
jgi:hypothetical protein